MPPPLYLGEGRAVCAALRLSEGAYVMPPPLELGEGRAVCAALRLVCMNRKYPVVSGAGVLVAVAALGLPL